jgi:DNA-directed RNA polymerase subunit RPC12/RpoP
MKLVTIQTYTLPHEVAIHRGKLEAMGVQCFVQDELTVQMHNFYSNAIGGIKLQVKDEDVNRALELLNEEFTLESDYSDSKFKCPHCGSGNIEGKGLNGKISLVLLMITGLPIPIFASKVKCFDCHKLFKTNERKPTN